MSDIANFTIQFNGFVQNYRNILMEPINQKELLLLL